MLKEAKKMVSPIETGDLGNVLKAETRPVLLACIHWGASYRDQVKVLDGLSEKYGDALKVYLLKEKHSGTNDVLAIKGSPTFIVFQGGEEKGRMLGKTDIEGLSAFLAQTLPDFKG